MSAFIVDPTHIDAIVTFAQKGGFAGYSNLSYLGQTLLDENARSVAHRYNEPIATAVYQFRPRTKPISTVQFLKAVQCLKYQSCETDDWEKTQARKILDGFTVNALSSLPGYDGADWEIRP